MPRARSLLLIALFSVGLAVLTLGGCTNDCRNPGGGTSCGTQMTGIGTGSAGTTGSATAGTSGGQAGTAGTATDGSSADALPHDR
jgi:hypothetical protein